MQEIWKDITGYEGLYQISNLGRLKSLKRKCNKRLCKEIIKKPSLANGYQRIALCKNGQINYYSIHRLVATAFIPNPKKLPCVNHKDTNRANNRVDNLEWCTYKENNNYGNHYKKIMIKRALYIMNKYFPEEKQVITELNIIKNKL